MEPVECYAAKKIIDLTASIGPSGTALVGLRNLVTLLAQAYGVSLTDTKEEPRPGYAPILDTIFLPSDEEAKKKEWKKYRESLHLASAVLARLTKLCHDRHTGLAESPKQSS